MLMEQCLAVYEDKGNWKDDMRHGKGKLTYADGGVYEGFWKDDKKHEGKMMMMKRVTQLIVRSVLGKVK